MGKMESAVRGIHYVDDMAARNHWINKIHPLPKVLITLLYIFLVISFDRYNVSGILGMSIYLITITIIGDISVRKSLGQIKVMLIVVCLMGIANPFIDRDVIAHIGNVTITGGMISMLTLLMKGAFAVYASYLLIVTTSIERICYALRILHIPKGIITIIMLIYRYMIVLLKETERMNEAYKIRAPGQKGIHIKAWGAFAGQLMLRSIDKAEIVYESMLLRGYDGEFRSIRREERKSSSIIYFIIWAFLLIIIRVLPVVHLIGNMFI